MASPTSKSRRDLSNTLNRPSRRPAPSGDTPEPVDPIWLLKAFGIVVLAALVCGYLTLCLIFYQGQWQLVLHPSHSAPAPAAVAGTPIQTIHFGVDESATPQLTGWWIPVDPLAHYASYTVLYLTSGDGSLADAQPTLAALHDLGVNVFAFDYRGYGQSAAVHPNQQRMTQDASSAWQYLTISRALPPAKIILYGDGAGGFLATQLAAQHAQVPAVILDGPRPDLLDAVLADPRVQSLPVRALFHERFDIAQTVKTLPTPKLFLLNDSQENQVPIQPTEDRPHSPSEAQLRSLVDEAAPPKMIVHLAPSNRAGPVFAGQLSRFLDEYLK